MDVEAFGNPRQAAQTALALLTASAYDDDESRFRIMAAMDEPQAFATLTALCALVVGGWPVDCNAPLKWWLVEVGKRLPNLTEHLTPEP